MPKASPGSGDAREFLLFALAFLVGFLGAATAFGWLTVRFGWREMSWWEVLPTFLEMFLASIAVGLFFCLGAMWLIRLWRNLTGTHHCPRCERMGARQGLCEACRRELDEPAGAPSSSNDSSLADLEIA